MLNSNYYTINEEEFFREIVRSKKKRARLFLQGISNGVIDTFPQYLDSFAQLQYKRISDFATSEEAKEHLIGCYNSPTQRSKLVRGEIFNIQPDVLKQLCPYCMLDRPKTLDHYIPKEEFPEYAMFVKNLIPCCYDCNNAKARLWRNDENRQFIHFYNDFFFTNQFLYSRLDFDDASDVPVIVHFLEKPAELSDDEFSIIEAHFRNLDLLVQYNARLNNTLSAGIQEIITYKGLGITEEHITNILLSRFSSSRQTHGVNYFQTVLHQTLMNNLERIVELFD